MHMFHDGYFGMGSIHSTWWVFIALLIVGAVAYGWSQRSQAHETPLELLQRRLAKGEITPDEYEKRRVLIAHKTSGRDE